MKQTDHRRQRLKDILSGSATAEQVQRGLTKGQPKRLNPRLLTEPEREALRGILTSFKNAGNSFERLSDQERSLAGALFKKVDLDFPNRHILDRVDLTNLTQKELEQTYTALAMS